MNQLQAIQAGLSYLESAARDLAHYRPRQPADVIMCRWLSAWLCQHWREKESLLI